MSFFNSSNNSGSNAETWTYQTYADSGYTQGIGIDFHSGTGRRGNWIVDGVLNAGNSPLYNFNDYVDVNVQTGTPKTITLRTNKLRDLKQLTGVNQRLIYLDLSKWDRLTYLDIGENVNNTLLRLTGITFSNVMEDKPTYFTFGGSNPISQGNRISFADFSSFKNIGGWFTPNRIYGSTERVIIWPTGHTGSGWNGNGQNTNDRFYVDFNNMTGTLDLTTWVPNNGFNVIEFKSDENDLDNIIFPPTNNFMQSTIGFDLSMIDCFINNGIKKHLDFSPLSGFTYGSGKQINIQLNYDLTGVTWFGNWIGTGSGQVSDIRIENCDIKDDSLDFYSKNIEIVNSFLAYNNTGCTNITFTPQITAGNSYIYVYNTGISNLNLSGITNLLFLKAYDCPNLTTLTLPPTTKTFANEFNGSDPKTHYPLSLSNNDLGYVNFLVMSGATMNVNSTYGCGIDLSNNNMTAAEVNQILTDFDNLSSSLNPFGWSGVTLTIGGTNSAPDSSSGGYNGIAAINSLTGVTNDWTIITS